MRTKHATLVIGFVGLFSLATACGDDDASPASSSEAGESGAGPASGGDGDGNGGKSSAGTAGTPLAGNGGMPSAGSGGAVTGNGGEPMGRAGEPSGNAGQTSGDGGNPSANGGESSGGNSSGSGGEPSGQGGAGAGAGGEGNNGPVECTALTLAPFGQAQVELSYAVYVASFTPNIVTGAADNFRVAIQSLPYDGDRTGTFDLTENGDDNYRTCARCLLVYADGGQKIFYPSQGTLQIAPGSRQLGGTIDATITNLKLVEVKIADDSTSTPVPNGACLTVASATVQVEAPPCSGFECNNGYCVASSDYECDEELDCPDDSDEFPVNPSCDPVWLCQASYYGDGDCDCGCGIQDVDCTGTADQNECDYCIACQGNFDACADGQVDPANTTQCL